MPLPVPTESEDKDEFISRCMGDDVMVEEFPDNDQRYKVCKSQWEKEKDQMSGLKMIKNAKESSADIWIYEDIGEGWFGGFSAKRFIDELKGLGKVDKLNIYINSAGGDVFEGVAIYNILKRHKAEKVVEVDALAASIASVIAMAGDTIRMAENSIMMVHNPWGGVSGDADDMRKFADELDQVKENVIMPAYIAKTGLEEEKVSELMQKETWMSSAEALGYGFIDEVVSAKQMAAHIDKNKFKFKNVPEELTKEPEKKDEVKVEDYSDVKSPAELLKQIITQKSELERKMVSS